MERVTGVQEVKDPSPTSQDAVEGKEDSAYHSMHTSVYDQSLSWDFIPWLRSITKLPILLKGILSPDDAYIAVHRWAAVCLPSLRNPSLTWSTRRSHHWTTAILQSVFHRDFKCDLWCPNDACHFADEAPRAALQAPTIPAAPSPQITPSAILTSAAEFAMSPV